MNKLAIEISGLFLAIGAQAAEVGTNGLSDFFGAAVKLGEMNGNITQMILGASFVYLLVCVALQRISNRITTKEQAQ